MKELFLKIRHWIIKKLGGYTERTFYASRKDVHICSCHPLRFRAAVVFPSNANYTKQEIYDRYKMRFAYKIAKNLVENDLIHIDCTDDVIPEKHLYTADVFVVAPKEAIMHMRSVQK